MATPPATAHLLRALALANRAVNPAPNPRVGAVVVAENNEQVGEGWHAKAGEPHAEVLALRAAGAKARGGTLYVTLEPCRHHGRTPPCTDAILAAGVRRVVIGLRDPTAQAGGGAALLRAAGVRVQFAPAAIATKCRLQNQIWLKNVLRKLPYVTLKLAFNLAGHLLSPTGERWITGPAARTAVQHMRAAQDAIMVGVGTALADDPLLTVRGETKQPIRIILDRNNRFSQGAKMLAEPGETWILSHQPRPDLPPTATQIVLPSLELPHILAELYRRGITSVLVEGGENVARAFWQAGLVDQVAFFYGGYAPVKPLFFGCPVRLWQRSGKVYENDFLHSGLRQIY